MTIEVRGLTRRFGDLVAVDDVTFSVGPGEVFGFIGPNGAGKTTTMRILATLLDPTDGIATVCGLSVVDEPEAVRRMLGFMPDAFGVYDGVTVREYLDLFASAHGIARRERAHALGSVMELTDLAGLAARDVSALSKGMRQRLALARALVHDPRVLILDEPAAGLDPRARIELRALIKELGAMGKTVLISSHILTELADMCGHVGIIERGRLRVAGAVGEIGRQLARPVRRVRVRVLESAEQGAEAIAAVPGVAEVARDGDVLAVSLERDHDRVTAEVVRRLALAGVPVAEVTHEKDDLEAIFLKVTAGDVN